MYICVYIYIHIYVYIYVYVYIYIYIYVHVCINTYIYIYTYMHTPINYCHDTIVLYMCVFTGPVKRPWRVHPEGSISQTISSGLRPP